MKKVKINNKVNEIPKDIKLLYGKFYTFSFILMWILLLHQLVFMKVISIYSNVGLFILLPIFYIFMIRDVLKRKKTYKSNLFLFSIVIIIVTYLVGVAKFIFS